MTKDYDVTVESDITGSKVVKDNLKENVEKATEFLESCFDDNNDDDLSFDERVNQRKHELAPEVLEIVESAQIFKGKCKNKETIFTGEKVRENESGRCKLDCDCDPNLDIKMLLKMAYTGKALYKEKKRELDEKKAELQFTDWTEHFPDKKPTESEKKAWITLETKDLVQELDDIEVKYQHLMDLFKLEKLLLQL